MAESCSYTLDWSYPFDWANWQTSEQELRRAELCAHLFDFHEYPTPPPTPLQDTQHPQGPQVPQILQASDMDSGADPLSRQQTRLSEVSSESVSPEDSFANSPAATYTRQSSFSSFSVASPEHGPTQGDLQDIELQRVVADEVPHVKISAKSDPFADFECHFGFHGKIVASIEIPDTKTEFIRKVQSEKEATDYIQDALKSYIAEISSGKHHLFSARFLQDERQAADLTIAQLTQIKQHLDDVISEVKDPNCKCATVPEGLKVAFSHAVPWIARIRQISVSNHVFYKINYVLGTGKDQPVTKEAFQAAREVCVRCSTHRRRGANVTTGCSSLRVTEQWHGRGCGVVSW